MHDWLKLNSNFSGLVGFCQFVVLYQGGSATNRATPSYFKKKKMLLSHHYYFLFNMMHVMIFTKQEQEAILTKHAIPRVLTYIFV